MEPGARRGNDEERFALKRLLILAILVALVGGYLLADFYSSRERPAEITYVGRSACIECHQPQFVAFEESHHDKAMDLATEATVLGDFDDAELEHFGIRSRFFRDGSKYMVHTEGPSGEMEDFEVKYVFGVSPLQQYMVELDRGNAKEGEIGRVQVLRLSWDVLSKKWFYLSPPDVNEKLSPDDPLHWTGITQCWNSNCAECHSTHLKKNFEPLWKNYHTTFSEIDVSCEACHGPGSFHVELAKGRGLFWDHQHGTGLVSLKDAKTQVDSCAPCHSRRVQIQEGFVAGCNFDDYYSVQSLSRQIYHDDGQIRDEVYVYGSFTQSRMYHQGIKCTDCHDAHSARLIHKGNAVCTSCHQHPAGTYDSLNHHHHAPGTPGSNCVDCHMPHTTYMAIDDRRDHSFRVPRPDLSVSHGTPNACTACHLEQDKLPKLDLGHPVKFLDYWIAAESGNTLIRNAIHDVDKAMADACAKWYAGPKSDEAATKSRYYELLTRGKDASNEAESSALLEELARQPKYPDIFRASAAEELAGRPNIDKLEISLDMLEDESSQVVVAGMLLLDAELRTRMERVAYAEEIDWTEFRTVVKQVGSLLSHSSMAVRIEAGRIWNQLPDEAVKRFGDPEQNRAATVAISELKKHLLLGSERGINQARLGGLYDMLGQRDKAKDAYRTAVRVEPGFVGARGNLANLLERDMQEIQQRLSPAPGNRISAAEMARLSEQGKRIAEEIYRLRREEYELLKIDVAKSEGLPETHGLYYQFGMASYLQGEMEAAREYLGKALQQQPENPTYLTGLATFLQRIGEYEKAAPLARKLLILDPENEGYQSLAEQISAALKGTDSR